MNFLDRITRPCAMTGGIITGALALVFNIAGAANKQWITYNGHNQGIFKVCMKSQCTDLEPSGGEKTALNGVRAFVILGILTAMVILVAAAIGRFWKSSVHPWPKITFLATFLYFGCNLIALVSFASYKDRIGRGSVAGGKT
eukprot:gb/GECG01011088.1/.p1 GENE.gb/GECG01011088.1/~~gb/GECG01011088.1/.p1  ORF type:complete len:142 (+),score=1.58 gb/GECG01011088.1/:1-426(+)